MKRFVDVDADDLANLDLGYVAREDAPLPDDLLAVHAQDRRRAHGERPEQGQTEHKDDSADARGFGEFHQLLHAVGADHGFDPAQQPVYFEHARAALREIATEYI